MKTDKSEFTIIGAISRKFVAQSGKFASLSVETSIGGRRTKHDIKFFDHSLIQQIDMLGAGELITVIGKVGSEVIKDKSGKEVSVDGYNKWVASLVGEKLVDPNAGSKMNSDKASTLARKLISGSPTSDDIPDDDDIPA